MNSFQTTILAIAVVILLIIFIGFAVLMASNNSSVVYPPSSLPCPDYWQQDASGNCIIPTQTTAGSVSGTPPVNMGTWTVSNKLDGKTAMPGLVNSGTTGGTINFNDQQWGKIGGLSATCTKRAWAQKYSILWDGVSNYNSCT